MKKLVVLSLLISTCCMAVEALPSSSVDLNKSMKSAFDAKKFDQVIELAQKNLEKLDHDELFLLAQAYFEKKDYSNSLKSIDNTISRKENDHVSMTMKGKILIEMNKDREAMQILKKAAETSPNYEPAYVELVRVYERKKNVYELRILFQDMLEKFGEKSLYLQKLCELSTGDGLYDLSQKYCARGIEKFSDVDTNYVYLGVTYKQIGEDEKSERELKLGADKFSKSELANFEYAKFLLEKNNSIDAFKYFVRATEADPKSTRARMKLALVSFDLKKYDVAYEAYKILCKDKAKDASGNLRRALRVLQAASEKNWASKYDALVDSCALSAL